MDNRKVNPWHQVLSKLNNLATQLSEVAKAMNSLAESNRALVRANALQLQLLMSQQEAQEQQDETAPPTHYLDGSMIRNCR